MINSSTIWGRSGPGLSGAQLHILAMGLMLCDHTWAVLLPEAEWLTCLGRLAFPIFAFLLAEGFRRTGDVKKYLLRLLFWAVVTEVPFDLMYGGSVFYPFHQNVLWTFLLSLGLMVLLERCRARLRPVPAAAASAALAGLGYLLGYLTMADYYGVGVLTVLTFWLFPGNSWKSRLGQLACLYLLNVKLLGGLYYEVQLLGWTVELVQQGLALLALIPIWLYQGRQGLHSRAFRYFCYAFYPGHILVLLAIEAWVL